MPRLIVPSSGGGRKLMRTLLGSAAEGEWDSSGIGEREGDSPGVGETQGDSSNAGERVGAGDSCAAATTANSKEARIGNRQPAIGISLNIIAPVHIREKVV